MPENDNTPVSVPAEKRKKWLRRILIGTGIALVALVLFLFLFLNWTIAATVRNGGPHFTGTPVELKSVSINIFTGRVQLNGFKVANPQGFSHPYAFELENFVLDMDMGTLFSKKLILEEVTIEGMLADYELGRSGSNLAIIQRNVEHAAGKSGNAADAKNAAAKEELQDDDRTIVIRHLKVSNMRLAMGSLQLPLPPISMDNLGDGRGMTEILGEFYQAMMKSVADVIASQTVKSVNDTAKGFGKSAGEAGKKMLNSFKKMFQ